MALGFLACSDNAISNPSDGEDEPSASVASQEKVLVTVLITSVWETLTIEDSSRVTEEMAWYAQAYLF